MPKKPTRLTIDDNNESLIVEALTKKNDKIAQPSLKEEDTICDIIFAINGLPYIKLMQYGKPHDLINIAIAQSPAIRQYYTISITEHNGTKVLACRPADYESSWVDFNEVTASKRGWFGKIKSFIAYSLGMGTELEDTRTKIVSVKQCRCLMVGYQLTDNPIKQFIAWLLNTRG